MDPIAIKLPDGKVIHSTHIANLDILDIPLLPDKMTECHNVPGGLAHSSLISTRKLCDAGCRVLFDGKLLQSILQRSPYIALRQGSVLRNMEATWSLPILNGRILAKKLTKRLFCSCTDLQPSPVIFHL